MLLVGFANIAVARAELPCDRPPIKLIRFEEDYGFLRDPECRTDIWDPIKYVALGDPESYLSLGADLREWFEYFHNQDWGREPSDGYLLHRFMVHADLRIAPYTRVFVQLASSLVADREGGPGPVDEDRLDLHQGFIDLSFEIPGAGLLTLRGGRQEIDYEKARLISVREGANVRLSFDGVRLLQRVGDWQIDAFAVAPVETDPGVFDDGSESGRRLWGVYAAGPISEDVLAVDLFYFGYWNTAGTFDQGTARETRHSLGVRVSGEPAAFDYNVELVYQLGSFGSGAIRAWTVASAMGYTIDAAPLGPRLGIQLNATSGDRDPGDPDLQTFNPLFPDISYFTDARLIGPLNHVDVHPVLELHPAESFSVEVHYDAFWRESLADGLYRPSGQLIATGRGNPSRYVGSEIALRAAWQIDRHALVVASYSHFFAGPFLRNAGLGRDVDFFAAWLSYRI